jgi:uncharacterized circularly permuted ATP-grasp superfamily protein
VVLANAIGTGVADDKSIYPYVPEMIRFYLGEDPILNNVPTWQCREPATSPTCWPIWRSWWSRRSMAPAATACWSAPAPVARSWPFRELLKARPDNYIAQPTLSLSTCPTFVDAGIAPATSTCAPSCSRGRSCAWYRAA